MRVEDQIKKNKKDINKLYEKIDILHKKHKISISQEINDEDDYQSKIQTLQIQIGQLNQENNELERVQSIFKGLKDPITNIIRNVLKMNNGENFKKNVTFQELIDYKTDASWQGKNDPNEKFKRFVIFLDELQYQLKFVYPFIDLNGVDLGWTTNQLIDYIIDAYFTTPTITIQHVEKERAEQNKDILAEDIVINMRNARKNN